MPQNPTTVQDVIDAAAHHGIPLSPEDIRIIDGESTLDGMPASQWLEAMTEVA